MKPITLIFLFLLLFSEGMVSPIAKSANDISLRMDYASISLKLKQECMEVLSLWSEKPGREVILGKLNDERWRIRCAAVELLSNLENTGKENAQESEIVDILIPAWKKETEERVREFIVRILGTFHSQKAIAWVKSVSPGGNLVKEAEILSASQSTLQASSTLFSKRKLPVRTKGIIGITIPDALKQLSWEERFDIVMSVLALDKRENSSEAFDSLHRFINERLKVESGEMVMNAGSGILREIAGMMEIQQTFPLASIDGLRIEILKRQDKLNEYRIMSLLGQDTRFKERLDFFYDVKRSPFLAVLLVTLNYGFAEERAGAASVLETVLPGEWVEPMIWFLKNEPAESMKVTAAKALGNSGNSRAVKPLIEVLGIVGRVQYESIVSLGKLRDKDAVPALFLQLESPDLPVRIATVESLGKIKSRKAVSSLLKLLKVSDGHLCRTIIRALGQIRDVRATDMLLQYLDSPDAVIREQAVISLGRIGDERAVKSLISTLYDNVLSVKSSAAASLRKITGQDFDENPEKWEKWLHNLKKKGGIFIFAFILVVMVLTGVLVSHLRKSRKTLNLF